MKIHGGLVTVDAKKDAFTALVLAAMVDVDRRIPPVRSMKPALKLTGLRLEATLFADLTGCGSNLRKAYQCC